MITAPRTMIAKFQVGEVKPYHDVVSDNVQPKKTAESLSMFPVTEKPFDAEGASDDNTFARWSPSGDMSLMVTNPNLFDQFSTGDKFYVSFHKAIPIEGDAVAENKAICASLDDMLQELKQSVDATRTSRERSIAIIKLEEAIMWLGKDLNALKQANPYPESMNPGSPVIHPPADGLQH